MIAALLLIAAAVDGAPAGQAVLLAQPSVTVLPAGTPVRLTTVGPLDSRRAIQGQRFPLKIEEDVVVGSRVVIPRGTTAVGEVEAVSGKGMFGKAGKLVLIPLFVDLNGQRVALTGATEQIGKDATAGAAVVSVLTPLGLIITGKSATIPAGSAIFGRVRSDVRLAQK